MVPPCSDRVSRAPPYSRTISLSTRTGLSPAMARLPRRFRFLRHGHWPGPRSLAATDGVSVDVLSSGYLDVSVRRVRFSHLCIQWKIPPKRWVAPFGNPRINACSRLPMAYRNVLRPSSPLSAKASTRCPSYACSHSLYLSAMRRSKPAHDTREDTSDRTSFVTKHQSFELMAATPTFRSSSVTKLSSIVKDPGGIKCR